MVWGSFLIAAAALKTPTRNGYTAQGGNLTIKDSRGETLDCATVWAMKGGGGGPNKGGVSDE